MPVTGEKKIRKGLRKALRDYPDAVAAALMAEGYALQRDGMKQTPVEFGVLRRSWYVSPPIGRRNPVVEVGVGTKYAIYVHENTAARHPVGKAKFISDPLNQRRSGYVRRVLELARKFVADGKGIDALPRTAPAAPSEESKRA